MIRSSLAADIADDARLLNQMAQCRFANIRGRGQYVSYLIQTYHYVVASVPLMRFALATDFAATDNVFADYLEHHIEEELGHDRWMIADLSRLAVGEEALLEQGPLTETCRLAGAAYYAIGHRHPAGILGYMHALESAPATGEFLSSLAKKIRAPVDAMYTLSEHGRRDTEHREELALMIDRYQGNPLIEKAIRETSLMTLSSLLALLKLVAESPVPRRI